MKYGTLLASAGLVSGLLGVACEGYEDGFEDVPPLSAIEIESQAVVVATLEAEKARLSGAVVASSQPGYTGTGFVDYLNASGDFVEWTVTVASAGTYSLGFRYANASIAPRPLAIVVNGTVAAAALAFPGTGSWSTWKTVSINAPLVAGKNLVRATATGTSGANIDNLVIGSGAVTPTPTPTPTPGGAPSAAALLALTNNCTQISSGKYPTDEGGAATVPVCKLNGAVFWKADMDIDCDGKQTSTCNSSTDPWFQNQTSFGNPLDAAAIPYVVVPLPSSKFNYTKQGISGGQSVAVIYDGKLAYGVIGDEGPSNIIGEASVAMAKLLGINPNPKNGGVASGVTYIVFTGSNGVVTPITNTATANSVGQARAADVLRSN